MAERYQHLTQDKQWQDFWQEHKLFEADNNSEKEKFYCLIEFPYPSGAGLHVGHCRSYTALDAIARKKRMQNFEVLFPLGWDAFGLPTENFAIKNKIRPQDATASNIENFKRQCQSVGFSFDWSREIDTTDPKYFKWTQWIFLQMFKKGLAEQKEMPINWCNECKTGLANEEVIDGKHERCGTQVVQRNLKQWVLKITEYADRLSEDIEDTQYLPHIKTMQKNWIGKSRGAEIKFNTDKDTTLTVYTTRPDTLEGATYMVISPEHRDIDTLTTDDQKEAVANYQEEAKKKSELERTQLDKKKTGVFTGSYATNPLNGESLPIWTSDYVLATYGTGAIMAVPHLDERDAEFAQEFNIPVKEIEPDDTILTKIIEQGVATEKINFKLHDWNFSRQRYWGEPIPLVHCKDCGVVAVPEEQLPLELPFVENYEPTDDATSPLSRMEDWVNTNCPKCAKPAKRETDTMPQWAGSSWYFLRYTDPHNENELASKEALEKWMNVDLYNGGMEHVTLHLLYSRFWHKFLYDIDAVPTKEPYTKRINHGMILGPDGEKMSKSRGNVINPDDVVQQYGADTLRVYELFIGPYDQVVAWSTNGVEGVSKFLQKVWRLQEKITDCEIPSEIDALLHKTIKKVDEDIENRNFNTAVSALMILNNAFQKLDEVPRTSVETFLKILTPLAPHIAEEMWAALGNTESIHLQAWPEIDESKLIEDTVQVMIAINGKVRSSLQIAPDESEDKAIELALADESAQKHFEGKEIIKKIYVPGKMINIVVK